MAPPGQKLYKVALISWIICVISTGFSSVRADEIGPIAVDARTGLAIEGFDPVAYFLLGRAHQGFAQHEARIEAVAWRFLNKGNLQAFVAHAAIYRPRFGGHDPVAVAKGFITPSDPSLFVIADNRLYLFHTPENLEIFRADPRRIIARADHQWPKIVAQSRR